jgi:hypothetical protein
MSLLISGDLRLRKSWQPMDTDAAAYIAAVETADGQALEEKTKIAIDDFVLGCKADGIWTAIKASCILAGARTLAGALVPLVGTAPTNFNFVSGDYNRKTGLVGNGTSKYLNSNRLDSADPQNNAHLSIYASTPSTNVSNSAVVYAGAGNNLNSFKSIYNYNAFIAAGNLSSISAYSRSIGKVDIAERNSTGLIAVNRSSSSAITGRASQVNVAQSTTSNAPTSVNVFIFAENGNGSAGSYSNPRLAFYSIGESLDLALLDARVTALVNAFAVAIP